MESARVLNPSQIDEAAELLKAGRLVAFPTETVYGLGACLFNSDAILSIFKAKGRPSDNPLIAHLSDLNQVLEIAQEVPPFFYRLAEQFMPGPLTVVLKRRPCVPGVVSAGLDTIALRLPLHPVATALIRAVGEPIVAPSANLSGKPSATQAAHVLNDFSGRIAAVIDGGQTQIGLESTVVSLLGPEPVLLRPGAITREQIEEVLKVPVQTASAECKGPVLSPGMKYRHYAPQAHVRIFERTDALHLYLLGRPSGSKTMLLAAEAVGDLPAGVDLFVLKPSDFYALLRLADTERYQEICILLDPGLQANAALMNRLVRAAEASS